MRYTIRCHRRIDKRIPYGNPPKWEAAESKMYNKKEDAVATAKWMNQEWGQNWIYAAFEYHGRGDYRIVDPSQR